jgi:hypothetical protein
MMPGAVSLLRKDPSFHPHDCRFKRLSRIILVSAFRNLAFGSKSDIPAGNSQRNIFSHDTALSR